MIRKILEYIFPNHTCLGCRDEINASTYPHICDGCLDELEYTIPASVKARDILDLGGEKIYLDKVVTPFKYNPTISKIILGLKYASDGLVAKTLAPFMRVIVKPENYDLVIPVPLSKSRQRDRGYNQAEILARDVFDVNEATITPDILTKAKTTLPQLRGMTTAQRLKNQKDAFIVSQSDKIAGKRILLVDDVITSGATTNEAARVLKSHGAKKVDILAIARV